MAPTTFVFCLPAIDVILVKGWTTEETGKIAVGSGEGLLVGFRRVFCEIILPSFCAIDSQLQCREGNSILLHFPAKPGPFLPAFQFSGYFFSVTENVPFSQVPV